MAADSIPVPTDRTRQSPPYDEKLPVVEARFTQGGHVARDPYGAEPVCDVLQVVEQVQEH